jgi:hypothetical protein
MGLKGRVDAGAIAQRFRFPGQFVGGVPLGAGHINDTYCVVFDAGGERSRYILQRINEQVFRDPIGLMGNVRLVTEHLHRKTVAAGGSARSVLSLILTSEDAAWYQDDAGGYWRAYGFIENARSFETVQSPRQAYEAARTVARFQSLLEDFPADRLKETIPGFHDTSKRFGAFAEALERNVAGRARLVRDEVEFALARKPLASALVQGGLPVRVTHNDTKLNNILFDERSGEGVCLVDLDTVMPGSALYDFGDMVRSMTCRADEDERDLSLVHMEFEMYEALAQGYLSVARAWLTPAELGLLAISGAVITYELGLRFLADYLAGDTYFKVHRPEQNLDRCRAQFALVRSIELQLERMNEVSGGGVEK